MNTKSLETLWWPEEWDRKPNTDDYLKIYSNWLHLGPAAQTHAAMFDIASQDASTHFGNRVCRWRCYKKPEKIAEMLGYTTAAVEKHRERHLVPKGTIEPGKREKGRKGKTYVVKLKAREPYLMLPLRLIRSIADEVHYSQRFILGLLESLRRAMLTQLEEQHTEEWLAGWAFGVTRQVEGEGSISERTGIRHNMTIATACDALLLKHRVIERTRSGLLLPLGTARRYGDILGVETVTHQSVCFPPSICLPSHQSVG